MITQLNPPLRLYIPDATDSATAIGVIDYGLDFDIMWICIMDKSGEIWTVANPKVRAIENHTLGRYKP